MTPDDWDAFKGMLMYGDNGRLTIEQSAPGASL